MPSLAWRDVCFVLSPIVSIALPFVVSVSIGTAETINPGDVITATIGLSDYNFLCSGPLGPCPTFPIAVLPLVVTSNNLQGQFSLAAYLKSTNDDREFFIGPLPFLNSNIIGLF